MTAQPWLQDQELLVGGERGTGERDAVSQDAGDRGNEDRPAVRAHEREHVRGDAMGGIVRATHGGRGRLRGGR